MKNKKKIIKLILVIVIGLNANIAQAKINDNQAILAIIGEAENQGEIGMLAVACVIRNRGSLQGVYGLKSKRVIRGLYSKLTYQKAKEALEKSKIKDITNGADHWENIKAFGKPKWAHKMKETYRYKDHVFYKSN